MLDLAAVAAKENALGQVQVAPLVHYHRAALLEAAGRPEEARAARTLAQHVDRPLCQPSRTADVAVLQDALVRDDSDSLAAMLLGNWHYDKRRYAEAIELWQRASTRLLAAEPKHSAPRSADSLVIRAPQPRHRRLQRARRRRQGPRGSMSAPGSWPRMTPSSCTSTTSSPPASVPPGSRDWSASKSSVRLWNRVTTSALSTPDLLTDAGRAADARRWLLSRVFQPWEGGEGQALGAWDAANIALAEKALFAGDAAAALGCLDSAVDSPASLGEARHPLANAARLQLLRGDALAALGRVDEATTAWEHSASFQGDFQAMNVQSYSEQSCYSAMALRKLGRTEESEQLIDGIAGYLHELAATPATIDYFATSLPTMLLFTEDPQIGRDQLIAQLRAQLDVLRSLAA